jgi:putative transposase
MGDDRVVSLGRQSQIEDPLTELLRQKASELLQAAVQAECEAFLAQLAGDRDDQGRRGVVRNGYLPEREVLTGIGPVAVKVPRVRDRTSGEARFESQLVPTYVRRAASVDAVLPWLYLRGISQAEIGPALEALVGSDAANLSAPVISRLKRSWQDEHARWNQGDLSKDRWVYLWVDGVYSSVRGDNERLCALVVIGVNERGQKRFLAIEDGVRESKQSWREVLLGLKRRGLKAPRLAVGDGVLNYLPKTTQPKAKAALQEIWMAETRATAHCAFDQFAATYGAKYPKATDCLKKDRDALLAFYDFPADHWVHLRTTNPIESTFATIRHRTKRVKGAFSPQTLMAMMFKLAITAEQSFRRIKGFDWMADVIRGVPFVDGVRQQEQPDQQRQAAA